MYTSTLSLMYTSTLSLVLLLPLLADSLYLPGRSLTLPAECSAFTVGLCDPNRDELIEEYPLVDSPTAIATCQLICQVIT